MRRNRRIEIKDPKEQIGSGSGRSTAQVNSVEIKIQDITTVMSGEVDMYHHGERITKIKI